MIEIQAVVQLIDARLDQIRRIVDEFPEEKIWQRPKPGMVSLGNLVCHLAGSMRDWFENGLAQGSWQRDRQNEFDRQADLTRQQLLDGLDEARLHCQPFIDAIKPDQCSHERSFRNKTFTVGEIFLRQLEHVGYHAGQAAFLRRVVADLDPTP